MLLFLSCPLLPFRMEARRRESCRPGKVGFGSPDLRDQPRARDQGAVSRPGLAPQPAPQPRPQALPTSPAPVSHWFATRRGPPQGHAPTIPSYPRRLRPILPLSGLQGPEGSLQARLSLVPYQPSPAPYVTSVQRRRGRRKCARPGSREARLRCHSLASGGSSGSGLGDSEADGESERGRRNEAAAGPGRAWRLTAPRRPPSHLLQAAARPPQGLALRGPLGSSDRGSRAPDPTL